jgi:hypothetical protein
MPIPLVLIHGYSDEGLSFKPWKDLLVQSGRYSPDDIHICSYKTLTNEVTIKDIAEGFDRALKIHAHLKSGDPFDAIVHSTGMLVLRSWLSVYGRDERHQRVKRIIALAPASFGSPLAHKGRSWIGALFKGNPEWGPDFKEAGDLVLDGLELGSRFTWDLAHKDLLGEKVYYGPNGDTPYLFTFCGTEPYRGLRGIVAKAMGTDGTVRWAGCALNIRKVTLDFTVPPDDKKRYQVTGWQFDKQTKMLMPFIPVKELNHATILEKPTDQLKKLVIEALGVNDLDTYNAWVKKATKESEAASAAIEPWQQFVVHARDERHDPITDFNLQLYKVAKGKNPANTNNWEAVEIEVHAYSTDNSYRCFHVNLKDLQQQELESLRLEFIASSGTELLGYLDYLGEEDSLPADSQPTFTMDLTDLLSNQDFQFFYPFTTTLIEVVINREPKPFRNLNKLVQFMQKEA